MEQVNSGKMDLKKKSTEEMVKLFEKHSFPKKTGGYDDGSGYSYLLNQKIVAFSTESVQKIEGLVAEKEQELKHVQAMKVGEGAKIHVGNLEHDLEEDYDAWKEEDLLFRERSGGRDRVAKLELLDAF